MYKRFMTAIISCTFSSSTLCSRKFKFQWNLVLDILICLAILYFNVFSFITAVLALFSSSYRVFHMSQGDKVHELNTSNRCIKYQLLHLAFP